MTFYDNLNRLCKEQGTHLTPLLKSLGYSSSKATAIKKGQIPNNSNDLMKLAAALHCSVMDFFADEEDLQNPEPQDEDEQDILSMFRSLSRREKHEFMAMVYEFGRRKELEGDKPDDKRTQSYTNSLAI